jgi:hypothetical protein
MSSWGMFLTLQLSFVWWKIDDKGVFKSAEEIRIGSLRGGLISGKVARRGCVRVRHPMCIFSKD